jgi:hypothetical protein
MMRPQPERFVRGAERLASLPPAYDPLSGPPMRHAILLTGPIIPPGIAQYFGPDGRISPQMFQENPS